MSFDSRNLSRLYKLKVPNRPPVCSKIAYILYHFTRLIQSKFKTGHLNRSGQIVTSLQTKNKNHLDLKNELTYLFEKYMHSDLKAEKSAI